MFTGCGTALVTPFRKDQSLDEDVLRRLVRRQIEAGIDFLVPCGTTGESPTLTRAEHLRVIEITLEEAKGEARVLGGAGGYNTAEVIELARELEHLGVDGILSVTPYYNKPTQEGLYQLIQPLLRRLIVIRRHGQNSVDAEMLEFAGQLNHLGCVVAAGSAQHSRFAFRLFERDLDDAQMFCASQRRALARGAAGYQKINTGFYLPPHQPAQNVLIERLIFPERCH